MHYHRNLPHIQPTEAVFFITMRLSGSIPTAIVAMIQERYELDQKRLEKSIIDEKQLNQLKADNRKRYFAHFEHHLDHPQNGPYWLSKPEIANIVKEALHFREQEQYDLIAYTIMSNHIHIVIDTRNKGKQDRPLFRVLQSFKSHTGRHTNKLLGHTGSFWHQESYDHVVRDSAELENIIRYVLENPVKAKLVENWQDWPHTYVNEAYL
ncbi:transposase [Rudanella lutea]|uniref:transposase n=1 Tax=Rudanella lutea TaxID=451374 RepID=UPI0005C78E1C|nr:transposase [Rudanella lutea]